jgi:hypothetical protein
MMGWDVYDVTSSIPSCRDMLSLQQMSATVLEDEFPELVCRIILSVKLIDYCAP